METAGEKRFGFKKNHSYLSASAGSICALFIKEIARTVFVACGDEEVPPQKLKSLIL